MKLVRLALEGHRGVEDGAWSFANPSGGAPLATVYVTGPAASGKTTFLEAIIALRESVGALGAAPVAEKLLRAGAKRGKIEGTFLLDPEEMARAERKEAELTVTLSLDPEAPPAQSEPLLRELFAAYSHDPAQGKLEYFPSSRRVARRGGRKPPPIEVEGHLRPARDPDKYAFIEQALIALALDDGLKTADEARSRGIVLRSEGRDSLGPCRRAMAELCASARLTGVEAFGEAHRLRFDRAAGGHGTLDDLSESEQQAFLIAATFTRLGLNRSLVLLDEPELHQHADAQLGFVRALGRLGQNNQLFLATGSLEILRTAAPHEVVRLGPKGK
ncbi:MAG: hypothetical protein U0359_08195 [Byssovorax sp.]